MRFQSNNLTNETRIIYCALGLALYVTFSAQAADAAKPVPQNPVVAKPDKNAVKASNAVLQTAIAVLEKEVTAHADNPKSSLRAKCNYFIVNPPPQPVVPEVLVELLNTVFSPDGPSDSYIKWQLLSAAPPKLVGESAHLASIAYFNAGKPIHRPGLAAADKKELDAVLKEVKTLDDSIALTQKLTELIDPWQKRNAPVLAYRDELYSRLPQNGEALVARLEDIAQRVEAGYESRETMASTIASIDQWIDTEPPASHLQIVADQVTAWMYRGHPKLPATIIPAKPGKSYTVPAKRGKGDNGLPPPSFPPTYYDQVEYVPDLNFFVRLFKPGRALTDDKQWHWSVVSAPQVDGESLSDLVVTLEEYVKIAREAERKVGKK